MTLGQGILPQITRSPHQRPQMDNDRRTEHTTTQEKEEVHLHYQSRREHCTLWTPLFLHTTNHHGGATLFFGHPSHTTNHYGGATNTLFFGHPFHYQSPRGTTSTHSLDTPSSLFLLPSTTGAPQKTTLLWTPLFQYQSPQGHTLSLDTPLSYIHTTIQPSYGRSTAFHYLSSLSRVQAGVAAP